ncbi:MAG TPA: cell division protein FtsA [Rhizomicrobium sp.]|jgi:cell division protein FtsA|nr:cell division protein FtsA [Rhizomicrobium sp.]
MRTSDAQSPAYRSGLVAALDVGTSKTVCLVGKAEPASLRVIGASLRESRGMRAGTVTSLEHAQESIQDAISAAENMADLQIRNVLVSVNCGAPQSITARAAMTLGGALVSDSHLLELIANGRANCGLDGHEIIHCAPTSYVVDEARGVRDPSGMYCERIGVQMHAVAVKPSPLQNLKLAVERCHLGVVATLFASHASGMAVLTPDELQLGATVIDMGAGVTSIAVFMEGALVHADLVPKGGFHVTADIARMLSAPLSAAERIKTLYGAALGDIETGTDLVAVPQTGENEEDAVMRVPRSMLTRIIQPRLEEILGEVQTRLRASGYDVAAGRRAVLTGGACQLAGMRELVQRVLNKQVRIGRPQGLAGLAASAAGPDYATAVGLLLAGATMPPELLNPEHAPVGPPRRGFWDILTGGRQK